MKKIFSCFSAKPEKSYKRDEETHTRHWYLLQKMIHSNNPVPLKSASIDVKIEGYIANVQATLCFVNVGKYPLEARFEFPMDDQSVLYHFEAHVEDRLIITECQEKKEAKETYKDAVSHGYTAVLMEEDDFCSDVFCCYVGNLPPGKDALIKFSYVTELFLQPDGSISFVLPTVLNPRYSPDDQVHSHAWETKEPYKFDFKAVIRNPGRLVSIKSLKDDLNTKMSDDKGEAQVNLAKAFVPDHDLTLDISFEEGSKPHLLVEEGDNSKSGILTKDVIMLNFFPELKETDYFIKHEFIFVVDRSGSMSGSRIEMARETLLLFLKSLPSGCYFNIVGFGSTYELLFPDGSKEYSEETLKTACEHQKSITANLGGTEILRPLEHIYGMSSKTNSREILLLTDGDVTNTQAVINLVKKNATSTRVFSFGIGEGASTALVKGVARAGRGTAAFTKEGERLQPLVMKTLKAAMQVSVTDLHLDWQLEGESCKMIQMPKELPPLFAGERLIIYALASADKVIPQGKVQLKGKLGERSLEFELDISVAKNVFSKDETLPIHRLAAKAQIKQLQDSGKDENKASIVLLSTAANVISCHTSMVGVDKNSNDKITGYLRRREEELSRLFDAAMHLEGQIATFSSSCRSSGLRSKAKSSYRGTRCASAKMCAAERDCLTLDCDLGVRSLTERYEAFSISDDVSSSKEPTYMSIVMLQEFSGHWKLNTELAELLGVTLDVLENVAPTKNLDIWATVLALSYLGTKFSDKHDEWEMIATKGRQWMDLQDLGELSVEELLQKAQAAICKA